MTDEKVTADEIIAAMREADEKKSGKGGSASLPTPDVVGSPVVSRESSQDEANKLNRDLPFAGGTAFPAPRVDVSAGRNRLTFGMPQIVARVREFHPVVDIETGHDGVRPCLEAGEYLENVIDTILTVVDELRTADTHERETSPPASGEFTVDRAVLSRIKVALVAVLDHPFRSCNAGYPEKCFVCDGLAAIEEQTGHFELERDSRDDAPADSAPTRREDDRA